MPAAATTSTTPSTGECPRLAVAALTARPPGLRPHCHELVQRVAVREGQLRQVNDDPCPGGGQCGKRAHDVRGSAHVEFPAQRDDHAACTRTLLVLEPGGRVQLDLAVLADGFADHLQRLPESIGDLAQVRDAGSGWHDPLPTLYSALAMCHSAGQSFRQHIGQMVVMVGDMNWDGEPIDGMSEDDATLLTSLRPQPGGPR